MMVNPLKLSQALNSRLCHEIAGLISAVSTSVEVIGDDSKSFYDEAGNLLKITSQQLADIMNFYRIAYGYSEESFKMDLPQIKDLCESVTNNKISIIFIYDEVFRIDSELAKVILCLIISLSKSIIKEGKIAVLFQDNLRFEVSSKFLKKDEKKINILSGKSLESELNIDNSHEYYIHYLIKDLGLKIIINQEDEMIIYSLVTAKSSQLVNIKF